MKSYNGFTPEQRQRGGELIKKAIADGILPPLNTQPCVICGQDKGIRHYHCEDYSEENVVADARVVCWQCHMMIHTRFSHPQSFARYMLNVVLYGKRFEPVYRPNDWAKLNQHYID